MKYQQIKTESFRVIPIKGTEILPVAEEQKGFKQIINTIVHMNKSFTGTGRIREGKEWIYRDEPNFSYKLMKKNGKIHHYVSLPQDQDQKKSRKKLLRQQLHASLLADIQSCRLIREDLELSQENLHAFSVQGFAQYAIDLDQAFHDQIQSLFRFAAKDDLLYSLTMKEVIDHDKKRTELLDLLAGKDPSKRYSIFHQSKAWIAKQIKENYKDLLEEKQWERQREIVDRLKETGRWWKGVLQKESTEELEWTNRKTAESNRYTQVEILFLLWTDNQEKAERFQTELQKLMSDMEGENELKVVSVKPDLERVQKGQLQYDVIPQLCLYQTELSKFLYIPNVNEIDESFYFEQIQKTQIPEMMFKNKIGSLAFGRDLYNNQIIYMPCPISKTELDDRVKGTIVVGEQGSGKTSYLENQILETYLGGATNKKEWLKYGRSVIGFEVADGALMKNIQQHIPEWAKGNVIILNHADTNNPVYVGFHDVIKVNKESRSIKKQVADTETKVLLDSMGDDSKTIAVERYFKSALQASYEVGKGNLIDALRILKDQRYMCAIQKRLEKKKRFSLVKILEDNETDMINDPSVLKTIKNRLIPFMADDDFMNLVAQDVNEEIDFYKWMNTEPYLVLIYLPGSGQEISQELRKFLFTHYFIKIWMLMLSRERIEQDKRKECLVIVDELHQGTTRSYLKRVGINLSS